MLACPELPSLPLASQHTAGSRSGSRSRSSRLPAGLLPATPCRPREEREQRPARATGIQAAPRGPARSLPAGGRNLAPRDAQKGQQKGNAKACGVLEEQQLVNPPFPLCNPPSRVPVGVSLLPGPFFTSHLNSASCPRGEAECNREEGTCHRPGDSTASARPQLTRHFLRVRTSSSPVCFGARLAALGGAQGRLRGAHSPVR